MGGGESHIHVYLKVANAPRLHLMKGSSFYSLWSNSLSSPISADGDEPLEAWLGPHLANCEWNMGAWLVHGRRAPTRLQVTCLRGGCAVLFSPP